MGPCVSLHKKVSFLCYCVNLSASTVRVQSYCTVRHGIKERTVRTEEYERWQNQTERKERERHFYIKGS